MRPIIFFKEEKKQKTQNKKEIEGKKTYLYKMVAKKNRQALPLHSALKNMDSHHPALRSSPKDKRNMKSAHLSSEEVVSQPRPRAA